MCKDRLQCMYMIIVVKTATLFQCQVLALMERQGVSEFETGRHILVAPVCPESPYTTLIFK